MPNGARFIETLADIHLLFSSDQVSGVRGLPVGGCRSRRVNGQGILALCKDVTRSDEDTIGRTSKPAMCSGCHAGPVRAGAVNAGVGNKLERAKCIVIGQSGLRLVQEQQELVSWCALMAFLTEQLECYHAFYSWGSAGGSDIAAVACGTVCECGDVVSPRNDRGSHSTEGDRDFRRPVVLLRHYWRIEGNGAEICNMIVEASRTAGCEYIGDGSRLSAS
jgi:hypothetical protein